MGHTSVIYCRENKKHGHPKWDDGKIYFAEAQLHVAYYTCFITMGSYILALVVHSHLYEDLLCKADMVGLFYPNILHKMHPMKHGSYTRMTLLQSGKACFLLTRGNPPHMNAYHPWEMYSKTVCCQMPEAFVQSNSHRHIQGWLPVYH